MRILAGFDIDTGVVSWIFRSLDPTTNQPTSNPTAGFLPPDRNPPEGDGAVVFFVRPNDGLATNTRLANTASIVFDTNTAIDTPEWVNLVDRSSPVEQGEQRNHVPATTI